MREQTDRTYLIEEAMTFQRRSWIVESPAGACWGGWSVWPCWVCFRTGPLSERRLATSDNSVTVRYERFQRITRLA